MSPTSYPHLDVEVVRFDRQLLRILLHLPRGTSNNALYLQFGMQPLSVRLPFLSKRLFYRVLCSHVCQLYHPLHQSDLPALWHFANTPVFMDSIAEGRYLTDRGLHLTRTLEHLPIIFTDLIPSPRRVTLEQQTSWPVLIERALNELVGHPRLLISTYGSVFENTAGCGVVTPTLRKSIRLPDYSSPFDAEYAARDVALDLLLETYIGEMKVVVVTDSLSVLRMLQTPAMSVESQHIWIKLHTLTAIGSVSWYGFQVMSDMARMRRQIIVHNLHSISHLTVPFFQLLAGCRL